MTGIRPDIEDYRRDADEARIRISNTVSAIQNRLDPRVMANEVMDAAMERGREAVTSAKRSLQDRTIELSVAAAAIGVVLGAASLTNRRKSKHMTQHDEDFAAGFQPDHDRLAGVKESAARIRERAVEKATAAREYTADKLHAARERTAETWQSTRERASDYGERARRQASMARERTGESIDHNPLTAIIIGAAAGAILGALLPLTRRENAALGHTSDRVKQRTRDAARSARDAGKARFEELGLGVQAKMHLRELGDEAAKVAHSARQAVSEAARPGGNGSGKNNAGA